MPVMPRSGQVARREQTQQAQRDRVEEMSLQQRVAYQQQQRMMQQARAEQQQRLARPAPQALNYEQRRALRRQNVLTTKELEEGVEGGTTRGRCFRLVFVVVVIATLIGLFFLKVDSEVGIQLPEAVKRLADSEGDAAVIPSRQFELNEKDQAKIEEYEKLLNVPASPSHVEDAALTVDQRRKLKRRETAERKRQIEAAYKKHLEGYGQLVSCGRTCQGEHQQMQLAYEFLNQQVDHELWDVVLPKDSAKAQRERSSFVSPQAIHDAFEVKRKELEAEPAVTDEDKEDKDLALAELKESHDILINEESRRYYQLTGLKPPPSMSKVSARHGGWGVELMLRTHFHKLILTWMSFFGSSKVDLFVVVFVFLCLFLAPALARLPQTVAMAQRMTQEWEEMAELEKRAKNRT